MDNCDRTIELYTAQSEEVVKMIQETGCYYVKQEWIARKYDTVSEVFLNAYRWYVKEAAQIVPKPEPAESAIWTFLDLKYVERYPESRVLKLRVPMKEAVFFRMSDWNKILNLRYVGAEVTDEAAFAETLIRQGIHYEGDVYLKPYYPQLKNQLVSSWRRLFRFDEGMKAGTGCCYEDVQAGLWCLKEEWVDTFL